MRNNYSTPSEILSLRFSYKKELLRSYLVEYFDTVRTNTCIDCSHNRDMDSNEYIGSDEHIF